MPTISILIPAATTMPPDLLSQDFQDWQALLLGPNAVDGVGPCRAIRVRGTHAELLDVGFNESAADYLLILDPADQLMPGALSRLVKAASRPKVSGAIGGFTFTSPIGELPTQPFESVLAGLPDTLSLEHVLSLRPVSASVLLNRKALADLRPRTNLPTGTELDLVFRLAEAGHRFAFDRTPVARRSLRPLADLDVTLRDLATHIRVLADVIAPTELATAAADLVEAVIVLRAHQRAIADNGGMRLATATRFPGLYAQWWHRCGLCGPAPRHVLKANGGITEAVAADPALIARRIVSMCPRSRPPVLLGLGRNARAIARVLHSAGVPVIGRDDSLPGPPGWSAEDNIPVEVATREAPFDPGVTYIMTVLHDQDFLARLPKGLRIIRWSETPGLILAEWRTAALDWALRTGLAEPKPALVGAPV